MKELKNVRNKLLSQLLILFGFVLLIILLGRSYSILFSDTIFPVLQYVRCGIFSVVPWSVGDLVYVVAMVYLIGQFFFFIKLKKYAQKTQWLIASWKIAQLIAVISILLYLFWSALYAQDTLSQKLHLNSSDSISPNKLAAFDSSLIHRINNLAPQVDSLSLMLCDSLAANAYQDLGLRFNTQTKQSLFARALPYLGISGYFNPFTGEAQIDNKTPNFLLPFLMCHEMAHQIGIAAEDDANLMAYIRCAESKNPTFQYSAYFNIWLYAHSKVYQMDSIKANHLKRQLNPISLSHINLIKSRQAQYHTFLDDWSTYIFDAFLKIGNQSEGIESYRNVAYSALCWEQKQLELKSKRKR
jgi:hypothetical protein